MVADLKIKTTILPNTVVEINEDCDTFEKSCCLTDDIITKNDNLNSCNNFSKLLIVASRKCGSACTRNLFRRRVQAIFYEEKLFDASKVYILLASKRSVKLPFSKIKEVLILAFCKSSQKLN